MIVAISRKIFVCIFFVIGILAVYLQTADYSFVSFDDYEYIVENEGIQDGFPEGILWSLTTAYSANWHPLTWISHMLDILLYGMNAGMHHLTNILFHIANSILLFLFLRQLTDKFWHSAFVAALFAFCPVNVETVAWVSQRKSVLSIFFGFLSLLAYGNYVKSDNHHAYWLALLFYLFGLLSKPLLVTFPFLLLLLDYWPLQRIGNKELSFQYKWQANGLLLIIAEKIPFLILSLLSSVITVQAQQLAGAVASTNIFPLKIRLANSIISYVLYLKSLIWPFRLSVFYPHMGMPSTESLIFSCLFLISVSILFFCYRSHHPWNLVGWLWYLGTLLPMIGIIQVGGQAMADRYFYLPSVGIFIILSFSSWSILTRKGGGNGRIAISVLVCLVLMMIYMTTSWRQTSQWKNSVTLFAHTAEMIPDSDMAHFNLGVAWEKEGRIPEKAIDAYQKALQINPRHIGARNNMALLLIDEGRLEEALDHLNKVLEKEPENSNIYNNIGIIFQKIGKTDKAAEYFLKAIRFNPGNADAHNNIGVLLYRMGKKENASSHFEQAVRIDPKHESAQKNLNKIIE